MRLVSPSPHTLSIPRLRDLVRGQVIAPNDGAYDAARTVFMGDVDRRPAVIVRPADAADVARVVSLARETGLELAVRSGGHSGAGHGVSDGGIVLDLARLQGARDRRRRAHRLGRDGPDRRRVHGRGRRTRPRHGLRRHRLGRHRRDHAGRRRRLPRPQARPHDRRPARRRGRHRRRAAAPRRSPRPIRTCSGRSAAAAATSASPPGSSSACTRSARSSAGCSCCRRRRT